MSRRRSGTTKDLDDSAVVVQDSPVSSIKQKGNLTGNARIMRDHVLAMSNLIQAWNVELLKGTTSITEIKAIMYKKINAKKNEMVPYVSILQEQCDMLHEICSKMEKIVEDMSLLIIKISAVRKLEGRIENRGFMFLTWSTSRFFDICHQIHKMYQRELTMKKEVIDELCFCTDRDSLIFLEAAWLQEPYIDSNVSLNHEAMLREVGSSQFRRK